MKQFETYLILMEGAARIDDSNKNSDRLLKKSTSATFKPSQAHVVQSELKSWTFRGDPMLSNMIVVSARNSAQSLVEKMVENGFNYEFGWILGHEYSLPNKLSKVFSENECKILERAWELGAAENSTWSPAAVNPEEEPEVKMTAKDIKAARKTLSDSFGFRMWDVQENGKLSKARTCIAFKGTGIFEGYSGIYEFHATRGLTKLAGF